MTCIIGLEHENKVYLGCDSAAVEGWTVQKIKQPKIFKLGEFIIGVAGFPRASQLIQYKLSVKPQNDNQDGFGYLCTEFVDSVKTVLNDNDYIHSSENGKQIVESSVLFGYRKNLYLLDTNFQIIQVLDKYDAIGTGKELALGAMNTFNQLAKTRGECDPVFQIKKSLETASKYNMGVSAPFKVISI